MGAIKTCRACKKLFTGGFSSFCLVCEINSQPKAINKNNDAAPPNGQNKKIKRAPEVKETNCVSNLKCKQCAFVGSKRQLKEHDRMHFKVKPITGPVDNLKKAAPKIKNIEHDLRYKNKSPKIVQLPKGKSIDKIISKDSKKVVVPLYTANAPIIYTGVNQLPSGHIKTMNWSDLSGWWMTGGLPSLGKKK